MEKMIVESNNKRILANICTSCEEVLRKFNWRDRIAINGVDAGLTVDDLRRTAGLNKRKLLKKGAILTALERATHPGNTSAGCGQGNDFAYSIIAQVERIVDRLSGGKHPFEEVASLYHRDANKRVVVNKNNHILSKLIKLEVVNAIPEGTFFGNSPKEFNNYWVEVNRPGCWSLAKDLIEKEICRY